jgi:predicted acyltransferase
MTKSRLVSLDVFRGLTIAGMIIVNNPGDWGYVLKPLKHAEWHGWTPTDLIFPFFLFIVGVSISLSLSRRLESGATGISLYIKIVRRTLVLFFLGLVLAFVPRFDLSTLRIPGVLQRIALCYLISSLLFLKMGKKGRTVLAFSLLILYYAMLKWISVPNVGAGNWELGKNICGYIDRFVLGNHLYTFGFDPEGILSTIPAVSTTLFGTLAGDWLRSSRSLSLKFQGFLAAGIVFFLSGILLNPFFPVNKQLWTSTFVLLTAGLALLCLGVCLLLIDIWKLKKWTFPFLVWGSNAIILYFGSSLMATYLAHLKVKTAGGMIAVKTLFVNRCLVSWAGPWLGSLLFPLVLLGFWLAVLFPLYRKKIFIKI